MELSIIIPTKDRAKVLKDTLDSIAVILQKYGSIEAIVVNDSTTTEIDYPFIKNLTILRNPKNGVASARNLGASMAKSDQLLFLDDDTVIKPAHIDRVLEFLNEFPEDCLNLDWVFPENLLSLFSEIKFGRFMINNDLVSLKGWMKGQEYTPQTFYERSCMASQFLAMKKSVFIQVGRYNEHFPHAGFEDYDFQERLKKNGVKLFLDTRYTTLHNEFDRLSPLNWLQRREREGETRRVAVSMLNYTEKNPEYTTTKQLIYHVLVPFRKPIYWFTYLVPNTKRVDFIYHKLIHLLAGIYHFKGYKQKRKEKEGAALYSSSYQKVGKLTPQKLN